jgi:hypothetical protein
VAYVSQTAFSVPNRPAAARGGGPANQLLPQHADPDRRRVDLGAERTLKRQRVEEATEQPGKGRGGLEDLDRVAATGLQAADGPGVAVHLEQLHAVDLAREAAAHVTLDPAADAAGPGRYDRRNLVLHLVAGVVAGAAKGAHHVAGDELLLERSSWVHRAAVLIVHRCLALQGHRPGQLWMAGSGRTGPRVAAAHAGCPTAR